MIKRFLVLLFVAGLFSQLYSLEDKQAISKILIYGNTKTKESIIRKALRLEKGQKFESEIIEKSRKRLIDLRIFTHVEIETRKSDEGINILVIVIEKQPFFFESIADYSNETYKYFLGIKSGYRNLSGMNQDLWLISTIGNLKKIELGYQNNYHIDFFWGISLGNLWYKNDFYDFKESRFRGKIFAGKKISKFETNIWLDYEKISLNNNVLSDQDPDELVKFGVNFSYDSKDWIFFPSRGIFTQVDFYKALNREMNTVYDRYAFEFSSFFGLWKGSVLALNLRSTISEGSVPIYDKLFFGGVNTLRGLSVGTYSGNNSVVFTSEYRIPLSLERRPWQGNTSGSAFYLFSDFGSITDNKEDFRLKNFKSNYGVGLFWVMMEYSKLRIDMSVVPKLKFALSTEWKF